MVFPISPFPPLDSPPPLTLSLLFLPLSLSLCPCGAERKSNQIKPPFDFVPLFRCEQNLGFLLWLKKVSSSLLFVSWSYLWTRKQLRRKITMDSEPSSTAHRNLDEQIDLLMQCKPLSEQEVQFYFFRIWMYGFP